MTTTTHQRSTHIAAPVDKVFAYVEDPHLFLAAMAPMSGDRSHFTVEQDATGTTLTLAFEYSIKDPLVGKAVDPLAWNGDRDIDAMLASSKHEIET